MIVCNFRGFVNQLFIDTELMADQGILFKEADAFLHQISTEIMDHFWIFFQKMRHGNVCRMHGFFSYLVEIIVQGVIKVKDDGFEGVFFPPGLLSAMRSMRSSMF